MSENLKYWLWLQRALGEGAHINKIIEDFGSAKALYDANILEWRMSTALTAKQVNKLEETDINSVNEIIYTCRENNWQIIDYDDKSYPKMLKEIVNPPAVLYVDGALPDFDKYASMAIVGTRNAGDHLFPVGKPLRCLAAALVQITLTKTDSSVIRLRKTALLLRSIRLIQEQAVQHFRCVTGL